MILSMTGYGSAVRVENGVSYALELKSLNHRYVKLTIKLPEPLQFAEPDVEKLLRKRISRGSVSYTLRTRFEGESAAGSINVAALQGYLRDLARVTLPEGLYGIVPKDMPTIGTTYYFFAHKDLSDKLAYDFVKTMYTNGDDVKNVHVAFKAFKPKNMAKGLVGQIHPGAVKFYKEKGLAK